MLQRVDQDRLDKVLSIIKSTGMRKVNATLMRGIPENKGNVSAYLNGKKPMSENFYNTFLEKYSPPKKINLVKKEVDLGEEVSRLIEITINQQAAINILMKAFENVSTSAVRKEADKLFDEYARKSL
jgi:hypothetical protein